MLSSIFDPQIDAALADAQQAALAARPKTVMVDGQPRTVPYPFPSPGDWRDCWIYFLLLDRFNNPDAPARSEPGTAWDERFNFRQGGTFKGVQVQLPYLQALGARAIWLSPVLKNTLPDDRPFEYHGYAAQDFLRLDGRFASDGTEATAERELIELIDEAHARGMYVIFDIVLNHAGEVFDYVRDGQVVQKFTDGELLKQALGGEPAIRWVDGRGIPRPEWENNFPANQRPGPDDAVWPKDLQRADFFRRRGTKTTDEPGSLGFVRGDFDKMRQLVVEYDANSAGQEELRRLYGRAPVLDILVRAYQYLIAKYDIDGYRIDTVKYVHPTAVRNFGNAMREEALAMGKTNFFTFGEIYDQEGTISAFVGRNSADSEGFGIDAALDFPLFYVLGPVARGDAGVEKVREVFTTRKDKQKGLISSHGEAGRYFVSFLDNHDQNQRFNRRGMKPGQATLGLGLLFTLQGIPCLYYGTEQGLQGTRDLNPDDKSLNFEWVREALWGKKPVAFDKTNPFFVEISRLAQQRMKDPALRYGRFYFREVSGNGRDFGHSSGAGGFVAFSRILGDREVIVAANTNTEKEFEGSVVADLDLNRTPRAMQIAYSNCGSHGMRQVALIPDARFWEGDALKGQGETAALPVSLAPLEIQILVPA